MYINGNDIFSGKVEIISKCSGKLDLDLAKIIVSYEKR
jgi:hypothetical protein